VHSFRHPQVRAELAAARRRAVDPDDLRALVTEAVAATSRDATR
jgi:hypothetical protein